jgi:molecular chaperone DnaK
MSKEDIERAIRDAERYTEEDKRRREAAEVKNHAENLIFQSEKTLSDIGDKASEEEKAEVRSAIDNLRKTLSGGDTEAIKRDTEALQKAFYSLSEKLYRQAGGDTNANNGGNYDGTNTTDGDTYYNAEYEDKTDK